jgi:hypothetical protein
MLFAWMTYLLEPALIVVLEGAQHQGPAFQPAMEQLFKAAGEVMVPKHPAFKVLDSKQPLKIIKFLSLKLDRF